MREQAETLSADKTMRYREVCIGELAYTALVTLGQRVKALRLEQGWTQKELARRANIHSQTINNIEHGRNKGGWKSRMKLAQVFGISVAELAGTTSQEAASHAKDSSLTSIASWTDTRLLQGVFRIVRELERRGLSTDLPPTSPAPAKSPTRPRRHR